MHPSNQIPNANEQRRNNTNKSELATDEHGFFADIRSKSVLAVANLAGHRAVTWTVALAEFPA